MECYLCGGEPTHQCARCRRLYCDQHGGELCADCLSPASALPSSAVYRGSILALLAGTVVALWLMIREPGEGNNPAAGTIVITPSPAVTRTVRPQPSPTRAGSLTPAAVETATGSATPEGAEETATPAPAETPGGPITYTVQQGDTLFGIAERYLPADENLGAFVERIAAANGLDPQNAVLEPGQVLHIPR